MKENDLPSKKESSYNGVCNMQNLNISMENCYGIKKLETGFDFSGRNVYAIYAPNGVMKTSFANAFADFSRGVESKDLMFPTRVTVREIKDESNTEIDKDKVFVIEAYNENYKSDKISTLLVNKELKDEYDEIYSNIDIRKLALLNELRGLSKLRDVAKIEEEISEAFTHEKNKLLESLERIETEVLDDTESGLASILYAEIFNDRVLAFVVSQVI